MSEIYKYSQVVVHIIEVVVVVGGGKGGGKRKKVKMEKTKEKKGKEEREKLPTLTLYLSFTPVTRFNPSINLSFSLYLSSL